MLRSSFVAAAASSAAAASAAAAFHVNAVKVFTICQNYKKGAASRGRGSGRGRGQHSLVRAGGVGKQKGGRGLCDGVQLGPLILALTI